MRKVMAIAAKYPAAREAQQSRIAKVQNRVAEAFARRLQRFTYTSGAGGAYGFGVESYLPCVVLERKERYCVRGGGCFRGAFEGCLRRVNCEELTASSVRA
jgi:hypothetical protein